MNEKLILRRTLSASLFATLFLAVLCSNLSLARSEEYADYPDIRVNRVVQIDNGGALVINDTVTLSANASLNVKPLDGFQIGFPIEYRDNLAYFFAYDSSGRLATTLNSSSDGTGFSWLNVAFPEPINVSDGGSYDFMLVYVFLGLVKSRGTLSFSANFSLYPSLVKEAVSCNVTVMLPSGATYTSYPPLFLNKTMDSRQVLTNETRPLEAFANVSSWVDFSSNDFLLLDIEELRREIKIDGLGVLSVADFYQITNRAKKSLNALSLTLPPRATEVSVQDVYGTYKSGISTKEMEKYVEVEVSLRQALETDEKVKLLITYKLPFERYAAKSGWQDYALNVSLTKSNDWVIRSFLVTVSLPEGAEFKSSSKTPSELSKELFTFTAKFYDFNVTKFHEANISLGYQYLILWVSFRPTIWVVAAIVALSPLFLLRKPAKQVAVTIAPISHEALRKFVEAYEERRRRALELESLEQMVQRGKIPRRQYKLRKGSLDGRLSKLQKDLAALRAEIEGLGGHYAERMKRLEVAEAEIETLNRDIERVEVRYRRGELSADARNRLLEEYKRRKERAENTIAETLLRLQEEIH